MPPIREPSFSQQTANTIHQLSAAAKKGNWKKTGELVDQAKQLQETLFKEIYKPETENKVELLSLVREIETEITAHSAFLSTLKNPYRKGLDNIVSRMAFAVKKFFTLNSTQRKLADAIVKAEKAISNSNKESLTNARDSLLVLRAQIESTNRGEVYRLSSLALQRIDAHLKKPTFESRYSLEGSAAAIEQLLRETPTKDYTAAAATIFISYEEALKHLSKLKLDEFVSSPDEIVNRIALLIGSKNLLVNSKVSDQLYKVLVDLQQYPKTLEYVEAALKSYPWIHLAYKNFVEDTFKPTYTNELSRTISPLIKKIQEGSTSVAKEEWNHLAALSPKQRNQLFNLHKGLKERLTSLAETLLSDKDPFPFLLLIKELIGEHAVNKRLDAVQRDYLQENPSHIEIKRKLDSFPDVIENIRLYNKDLADNFETLFVNLMGNLLRNDLEILGDPRSPLKEAIYQKALKRAEEEQKISKSRAPQPKTVPTQVQNPELLREVGLLTKHSSIGESKTKIKKNEVVAGFQQLMRSYNQRLTEAGKIFQEYLELERILDAKGWSLSPQERATADEIEATIAAKYIEKIKSSGADPIDYVNAFVRGPFAAPHMDGAKTLFLEKIKPFLS